MVSPQAAGQQVQATLQAAAVGARTSSSTTAANPSQVFNLFSQTGNTQTGNVQISPPPSGQPSLAPDRAVPQAVSSEAELAKMLLAAGASASDVMQFLQSREQTGRPNVGPTEHRYAWLQALEGTSPLCVFTGMHSETRQGSTPRTLRIETSDATGRKFSSKYTVWPPSSAEAVPVYQFKELATEWKAALAQANIRLLGITPPKDHSVVPRLPEDVDSFLEHCFACLKAYPFAAVLRAWEATHLFMVDEYVARRSAPRWDSVWMMPVFQAELNKTGVPVAQGSGASLDVSKYCFNWNSAQGAKCAKEPDEKCKRLHKCMICGGEHRLVDCPRRD